MCGWHVHDLRTVRGTLNWSHAEVWLRLHWFENNIVDQLCRKSLGRPSSTHRHYNSRPNDDHDIRSTDRLDRVVTRLIFQCRPLCNVGTLISSHAISLSALYGPLFLHMPSSSVHCTDLYFFTCHQPRCTVRTFISSYAISLAALYGPLFLHMPSASVHCTDLYFFTCHQPRCTVRTFISSHAISLGALYGPLFLHMPSALVHCTDLYFFTCHQPRYTVRTFISSHAIILGALYGRLFLHMPSVSVHCTVVKASKVTLKIKTLHPGH